MGEKINDEVVVEKVETTKEEKKTSIFKKIKDNKLLFIILVAVILLLGIIIAFVKNFKSDNIKKVSKILPNKYYNIVCLDKSCDQIAAYKGSSTGKSKVTLLTGSGKVVASYKNNYDAKAKTIKEPYALTDNYFIYKKTNTNSKKVVGYSIADRRGKEKYSTDKSLKVLTNHLVLLDDTDKGMNGYSILNAKGKLLFKNVNDFNLYADDKIISAEIDGTKQILNEKGEVVLSDYYVATEVYDENYEVSFLLVEDSKNNSYNYFSLKSLKIVGDSFQNYSRNGDGTLTIIKKENNSTVKYTLYNDGKQKLIGDSKTQSEIANEIKKNVDTKKYNIYLTSVYDENQKYVFADDINNKTFGIYDIKTKKFKKIFSYRSDAGSLYASISKINNDNNLNYYQVSCSTYNCDKNEFLVYNLENGKTMYSVSDAKLRIQNYYQFGEDYKVVKYSYSSQDEKYKGKYVLFNKKNKEITSSSNAIVVVDRDLLIGSESSSSLILFSAKANKVLNNESTLGTRITLNNNKFYRYQTKDNTILLNNKGKEVLKIDSSNDIIYSDKVLVYIKNKKIYIFDSSNSKTRTYKLKKNEKMNDASGDLIAPYRGALFINNSSDNYIKVINRKGNTIKRIKKAEILNIYKTKSNNVVIITKNDIGKAAQYGLYIAK